MIRVCMTKCPGYNLKTGTKLANTQHFLLKYYIYIYTQYHEADASELQ